MGGATLVLAAVLTGAQGVQTELPDDCLYGRVHTVAGDVFEGYVRWDRNEGSWGDLLDVSKEIPWQSLRDAERLDRLFFGMVERDEDLGEPGGDDFWFEHPLRPEYTSSYRFSTDLFEGLADLPTSPVAHIPTTLRWGLQRPDLVRYNRVEGLSLGARVQMRPQTPLGPLSVTGLARIGVADRTPNVRADVTRETLERRITLSAFHELAAVDERARHLGPGNSLQAALFGRDDGDYYRRSGAWLEWTPPPARQSFRVRAFAERHRPVEREADFALGRLLDGRWHFRDNLVADEGWDLGGLLVVSPWWGTDPTLAQAGLDLTLQGARGDFEYVRASLVARLAVPLPLDGRLGLEIGGGTSEGALPAQRLWYLGGPATLRGYGPRVLDGPDFARARGELQRTFTFGALSIFSDVGWAGQRALWTFDDALYSVGLGASILDGLVRFDAGYGMRRPGGFRFDAYLDANL